MDGDRFTETFQGLVVKWARCQFAHEIRTNFRQAETFDFLSTQRLLTVLRDRPGHELEILARVLPLQVFNLTPDNLQRRSCLRSQERELVERFRAAYDQDNTGHWAQHVRILNRRQEKETKQQFNAAVRRGNRVIKDVASQCGCTSEGAARGEWGLIAKRGRLRFVISLKLARWMELDYTISIATMVPSYRSIFRGQYLADLGLGGGSWGIGGPDEFSQKLIKASEFAMWHLSEYEKLIKSPNVSA